MDKTFYMVRLIAKNCFTNPSEFPSKDEAIEFANWLDNLWSKDGLAHKIHIYEVREIER